MGWVVSAGQFFCWSHRFVVNHDAGTRGPLSLSLWSHGLSTPRDLSPTAWPKTRSRSFQTLSKLRHSITAPPSMGQSSQRASPSSRGGEINCTSLCGEWRNLQPSSILHQENGYLETISSLCLMSLQDKPPKRQREEPLLYKTHEKKH